MSHVIILRGPIGAGKTTVMKQIAQALPDCSAIELDGLKRMIDPEMSSEWRREVALNSAVFMGRTLLARGRSIVAEVHSRWQEQSYEFLKLAEDFADAELHRVLVTAPYETCAARVGQRAVDGIGYEIDERMLADYYVNLTPSPAETVIDTSLIGPAEAGSIVVHSVVNNREKG
jgi:predicted kinase